MMVLLHRRMARMAVVVESSYGFSAINSSAACTPNTIIIAGGVGITAALPYIRHSAGRVRLFWGVRTPALVREIRHTSTGG